MTLSLLANALQCFSRFHLSPSFLWFIYYIHPWINCTTSKMIEWTFKIIFRNRIRIPILHNLCVQHSYLITTIERKWIFRLSMSKQQTQCAHIQHECVFNLAHIEAVSIKLCTTFYIKASEDKCLRWTLVFTNQSIPHNFVIISRTISNPFSTLQLIL